MTAEAEEMIEAGFASKAAQKRALENLNRAYGYIHDLHHDGLCKNAPHNGAEQWTQEMHQERGEFFAANETPFDLHQVREKKHAAIFGDFWQQVSDLMNLRDLAKATPINAPVKDEAKAKEEEIRASVVMTLEERKERFLHNLDVARMFNGLPVTVTAHYVTNEYGTTFVRHFFYFNGKLTRLAEIIAIAGILKDEREGKA
ncbi:hypothetical protein [Roseibium aggregatum]|nr:hypothetical protein [Roseibium aggregatum]